MSTSPESKPPVRRRILRILAALGAAIVVVALGAVAIGTEMQTSRLQAQFFAGLAPDIRHWMLPGAGGALQAPPGGPYDERLGYSQLHAFSARLRERGFTITRQARPSRQLERIADLGLFPPYHEKDRAGLALLDCNGQSIHTVAYPERIYPGFDAIPPLLVDSLLFIENRELLNTDYPDRNPAVEWDRFAKAAADQVLGLVDPDRGAPGGSTLATQIEKYRHSPEGRTGSRVEKIRQMASASVRAYLDGENTMGARRRIVLSYVNTVPLSAKPGFGEVNGLGDGLWAWYGRDFDEVNRLLLGRPENVKEPQDDTKAAEDLPRRAQAYKQALSLMIAQRRPSYYLGNSAQALETLTNSYLRLLGDAAVITPALRDAALAVPLHFRTDPAFAPPVSFVTRKASSALRVQLSSLLGVPRFYDLDRLDLTAVSTLHVEAQRAVSAVLRGLNDPERARAAGLYGYRLLSDGQNPANVVFSFTLYEKGNSANLLRVQTDNYDQPFDINEGAKLDLGSTAKLRTLATYLEIFTDLHRRYAQRPVEELRQLPRNERDPLTQWAIDYLIEAKDRSLRAMLEAAMDRHYSGDPGEAFFTGGGLHTFVNFESWENKVMTVREGFRNSVNLVFIRMMRDIVHHYMFRSPSTSANLLANADDPRRQHYLSRFADREGRTFINAFYRKYQGKTPAEAEALLLQSNHLSAKRLAVILRSIDPAADVDHFAVAMRTRLGDDDKLSDDTLQDLYERLGPDKFSLPDRGYLAGIHPLELWLVAFLRQHPGATLSQVIEASQDQRLDVYNWLFRTRHKNAQDIRIRSLLEVEAFLEIGRSWRRLGYPFESLTPSYASSIGSSGDRPAALAELMGIIVNKGVRLPVARIDSLHFAAGTPYEVHFARTQTRGERVMSEDEAEVLRNALIDVVDHGTARRVKDAFIGPDGKPVVVGGKTGTGDNRYEIHGRGGRLISSRVVSRSGTFVFLIGDRFFGTITAYVREPYAADYVFTSGMVVQLLKSLGPALSPLLTTGGERSTSVCSVSR